MHWRLRDAVDELHPGKVVASEKRAKLQYMDASCPEHLKLSLVYARVEGFQGVLLLSLEKEDGLWVVLSFQDACMIVERTKDVAFYGAKLYPCGHLEMKPVNSCSLILSKDLQPAVGVKGWCASRIWL